MSAAIYLSELPEGLAWVNTSARPDLASLRGKAVLINFWTGSSIACEQQSQEIRQLETRFHDGLVVLGVHTPKHPAETEDEQVLRYANRLHLRHPVANDKEWRFWRQLAIPAWPSAALLDHQGRLVGIFPGEGRRQELEEKIQEVLDKAAEADCRSYDPAPQATRPESRGPLRFPTRLVASGSHLYVADTGYNRILELSFEGRVSRQFGSGNPGHWDARGSEAGFRDPVGLALWRDMLFVADTGNHVIRRIRLLSGEVETLAGNGSMERPTSTDSSKPRQLPLPTPTDLAVVNDRLYIAVTGLHQIWQLDLGRDVLSLFLGNGREEMLDGSGSFCSFCQPSALSVSGDLLYILDASSSSLRTARLAEGRVNTLIPGGLFSAAMSDGPAAAARMAHPTAIHADPPRGMLWIADGLNHKLRVFSLVKQEMKTLNVNYALQYPSGVCVAQQCVWIANSGAHEILKLDLKSGRLSRLPISH